MLLKPITRLAVYATAIFLLSLSQSFAINLNISNPQSGDVDLGTSASSTLAINNGGVLNGNVVMGNSAQITTFNGGVLNGAINGAGKVTIASDAILNGNIGANSSITSLTINTGKILDLTANNNSVSASGSLNVGSGSTLLVGSGTIAASIGGTSDGVGTVKFNANNNLGGSVGTATSTLSLVEIGTGVTLSTNSKNMDVATILVANNATLNYGSGTIVGAVEGKNSGEGNLVFNNTKTTSFSVGQSNQLSNISIANGATITLGDNIAANTINIGAGTSGRIKSNGKNISATEIKIFKGAALEINSSSIISGAINGDIGGNGIVQFVGSSPINWNQSLGASTKLAQVLIANENTLNINNNIILNADDITVGEGGSGEVGAPVLNQNNGIIGADANSQIRLNADATFNYNGGTLNGTVRGTSSNKGTFNINHDYINNSEIGATYDLANLKIANGINLTAGANISANNISVAGTLNLGNSSKTITGNLATAGGAATIDLGSSSHLILGNFAMFGGDILKINALNNVNVGSLKSSGNVEIASGIGLKVFFDSNLGYLSNGAKIAIISGASGVINEVSDAAIDVNNSGSNQSGLLTFHTEESGSDLFLIVDRKDAQSFTDNQSSAEIYENIDQVGAKATGSLRELQKFIDDVDTTDMQRDSALKSIVPQGNQDLNNSSFSASNSSVDTTAARLQSNLFGQNNSQNFTNNFSANSSVKDNIINLGKFSLSADEEIFDKQAIWIQGFKASASQNAVGSDLGYDYINHGLAIGVDQEVAENIRLGVSSSYSIANVKSQNASVKKTDISSYQFNLYGGYNFAPYFVSGVLGVAINQYDSVRAMPEMNLVATSNYKGQTYIAKFEGGAIKEFGEGFVITPKASITAAQNQISSYGESGAGTLNLNVSNDHSKFLEGRAGMDLAYNNFEISGIKTEPKIKLSYGYNFLAAGQTSKNSFQGQNSSFEIKSSNIDKDSLKYGLGINFYEAGIMMALDYDVEQRAHYQSQTGSIYLRCDF